MNAKLSAIVKKSVEGIIKNRLPHFRKADSRGFGGLTFVTKAGEIFVFLRLQLHSKHDRFTFEVAASPEPKYPFEVIGAGPFKLDKDRYIRARIHRLFPNAPKMDFWWDVNDAGDISDLGAIIASQSPEKLKMAEERAPRIVQKAADEVIPLIPTFIQEVLHVYAGSSRRD